MPMYEYRCAKCDERFEELVSVSADDSDAHCPECGSKRVERLLSAFAVGASSAGAACGVGGGGGCGGGGGFS